MSLNQLHPKKRDLVKTQEFRKWKNNLTNDDELSDEDREQATTTETRTVEAVESMEQSTTVTSTNERSEDTEQATTPETSTEEAIENDEDTEQATTAETSTELVRTEQNILELAAEELLPLDQQNMDNLDDMINDIVRDLQDDEALRDIFYNDDDDLVQPRYMDEDEGIGLNVEVELEDIIEPLDLEAEGFDFF